MLRFEYVYSFAPMRPPRVSVTTFTSFICCIYTLKFGQYWTSFCVGNSSVSKCLICNFCSSDRGFALGFLQTPPHDGCPCPWLTVPTAKSVADFHRQVIAHAERTTEKHPSDKSVPMRCFLHAVTSVYGSVQVRLFPDAIPGPAKFRSVLRSPSVFCSHKNAD